MKCWRNGESSYASCKIVSETAKKFKSSSGSYNGDFATKLILDFSLFKCVWTFLFNNREELFNTHLGDLFSPE